MPCRVGLVQMCSGADVAANLDFIARQAERAAADGVDCLCLPENAMAMGGAGASAWAPQAPAFLAALQDLARAHGLWLLAGTLPWAWRPDGDPCASGKLRAASFVIDAQGEIRARYDKIHLFDVVVGDACGNYRESDQMEAGDGLAWVDTPWGRWGLAVCYDLRFAELFSALLRQGIDALVVPAAFTRPTGAAHWQVLLRARAIESQVMVLAAAQTGQHDDRRQTYGHSLVVDPWGEVLLDAGEAPGLYVVNVDMDAVAQRRRAMPMAQQRRWPVEDFTKRR